MTAIPFTTLTSRTHIHLVGIGGTGLSAIAKVLLERGVPVSGSDRAANDQTAHLEQLGATVYLGHHADHIAGASALLVTSAAKPDNPEIAAALAQGIPVLKRREFLPVLLGQDVVLGIAGTHGKTTTTAMAAHILNEAGLRPGYIVGSVMQNTGTNASAGAAGAPFVIEADEYDDMYLGLSPHAAIVTSIEWDHPDFFPTEADMVRSFRTFIGQIQPNGVLILNLDQPVPRTVAESVRATRPLLTYGRAGSGAEWEVRDLHATPDGLTRFTAVQPSTDLRAAFVLRVPGAHNALNALAAALLAQQVGVSLAAAAAALETFESTGRRFQVRGKIGGVTVIDDYGHHPSAIAVTLEAARMRYPDHAIWAVWQPHTYSRTHALLDEYAGCFGQADGVLVMDIYASREQPVAGVTGERVAARVAAQHPNAHASGSIAQTVALLRQRVSGSRAVVIVFSAGDAPAVSTGLLAGGA